MRGVAALTCGLIAESLCHSTATSSSTIQKTLKQIHGTFDRAMLIKIPTLQLFKGRLVDKEERVGINTNINNVALKHFPNIEEKSLAVSPIM